MNIISLLQAKMLRHLSNVLRKYRIEKGLTQMQLSIECEMDKTQVCDLENMQMNNITLQTIAKIMCGTGMNSLQLLGA